VRVSLRTTATRRASYTNTATRHAVALLSLLSFALIAGAADSPDWVKGGIEFNPDNGATNSANIRESRRAATTPRRATRLT
jgi:hypothetical protein